MVLSLLETIINGLGKSVVEKGKVYPVDSFVNGYCGGIQDAEKVVEAVTVEYEQAVKSNSLEVFCKKWFEPYSALKFASNKTKESTVKP